MIFKRKLYDTMIRWKNQRKGETALLIKGARRVGKSTLVEEFAKREYKSYILIDFSKTDKEVESLFDNLMNLDYFFIRLQNIFGVTLHQRESVIVFDEVQNFPPARQAIKHLVKDGRFDYIETGSLLSIKKNIKDIIIPSEEHAETMFPMDFEEFYWACGNDTTPQQLREALQMKMPMGDAVHRRWMRDLRLYMLVGGMPQAVDTYLRYKDMRSVDETKREIIELYYNDFRRIDTTGRASRLFSAIPGQLNTNASRYQVGSVIENQTADRVAEVIADMEDSQTVTMAYHVNDPNVGMGLFKDYNRYKMFIADTGLFVTLAFWDKDYTENLIYNKLLSDKLAANLGYVYENLVAQMLRTSGNQLFYYTFPTENGNKNYEIDFMLSRGSKIIPIEVKSSGYKTHRSLDVFCDKYPSRIGDRILLYTKDFQKDGATLCLPVYYAPFL
ncbi:MAG: ATP-binding protein [Bacteroidales bacterium]|nr:ATP-binding protein [Bacteroidales bacterium]